MLAALGSDGAGRSFDPTRAPTCITTLDRVERHGGAGTSATSQLSSSIGAALLNTVAVSATASYRALHPTANVVIVTVHGFTAAMVWGTVITLAAAVPIALVVSARTPARQR